MTEYSMTHYDVAADQMLAKMESLIEAYRFREENKGKLFGYNYKTMQPVLPEPRRGNEYSENSEFLRANEQDLSKIDLDQFNDHINRGLTPKN